MFDYLICFVLFLILCHLIKNYRKQKPKSPPGPYGLPVIGLYPFLGDDPIEKIHELSKQYGHVMSINLLGETFWILNSYEAIKEALVTKGDIFAARHTEEYGLYSIFAKDAVIGEEGDSWRLKTSLVLRQFAKHRLYESGFEKKIHEIIDDMIYTIESKDGQPEDYLKLYSNFTFNVLSEMMYGIRYKVDDPTYTRISQLMDNILCPVGDYLNMFVSGNTFKLMMKFKNNEQNLRSNLDEFTKFTADLINQRMQTSDHKNGSFFIDSWIKESSGSKSQYFKHENLPKVISQLFLASTTPHIALYNLLYFTASQPNIQRRIFNEIKAKIGTRTDFEYQKSDQMPFTQAMINETMRFLSLTPLGVVHVSRVSTKLMGFDVPKRQKVIANLYALSRDGTHFANPNEFDPNNFLDEFGHFKPSEAFIPFGVGVRKCAGMKLAEVELFLSFVRLIQKFEWSLEDTNNSGSPAYSKANIRALEPYKVCAKRRDLN